MFLGKFLSQNLSQIFEMIFENGNPFNVLVNESKINVRFHGRTRPPIHYIDWRSAVTA